jgi:hypothetical protein
MIPEIKDIPIWYFILALIFSWYQAYRGFMFQWIFAKEKSKKDENQNIIQNNQLTWTRFQKIFLLCFADMLLYFICEISGFTAIFVSFHILSHRGLFNDVGSGLAALLIFLVVFGVTGISGQLPHLIQQGKLSPFGSKSTS